MNALVGRVTQEGYMELTQRAAVLQTPFTRDALARTLKRVLGEDSEVAGHEGHGCHGQEVAPTETPLPKRQFGRRWRGGAR